jgi:hypothetical protein
MRHQLGELTDALARTAAAVAREASDTGAVSWAGEPRAPREPASRPQPAARPEPADVQPEPIPADALDDVEDVEVVDAEEADGGAPRDVDFISERRERREREEPEPAADPDDDADTHLAARLVALQMAVAGGNRAEVEGHLRRAFDLSSPRPILDDIFGEGTGPGSRVAWPETATGGTKA